MKQYVCDQLRESDHGSILEWLTAHGEASPFGDVFWLTLPEGLLSETQAAHLKGCGPFRHGVQLEPSRVTFELLVRSAERLRCECIGYATPAQREHIIGVADAMLEELGIRL